MQKQDTPPIPAGKPVFVESHTNDAAKKPASNAPAKPEGKVYDPDEDEGSSMFRFSGIKTFFGNLWGKITTFSQSAASRSWGWCRSAGKWTWSGLRKIPSYCVIRWDSEEETTLPGTGKKIEPVKPEPAKTKPVTPAPMKTEGRPEVKPHTPPAKTDRVKIDFDEDELPLSRWWSVGIKTAAAAAALLILVGGYFAVKPLVTSWQVKTPAEVAEVSTESGTTEPSDSPSLAASQKQVSSPPIAVVPEPVPVIASPVSPMMASETPQQGFSPLESPPQGSLFDNDPFSASTTAPAVADVAPPIASDFFGTTSADTESSAPSPTSVPENEPLPSLAALPPLSPLDSVPITEPVAQPQLQPLVAIDSSSLPLVEVAAAPSAVSASANAPVASKYESRAAQRNRRNTPAFSQAPTPPSAVNTIPPTTVQQTLPIIESVKEIVPQIPHSGTIQDVPPPVAPPAPAVAEVLPVQSVYANESAPAIPKDVSTSVALSAPAVAEIPTARTRYAEGLTNESAPAIPQDAPMTVTLQITTADSPPIDEQLWNQIRELRNESETTLPSTLRFGEPDTALEPALRFTPKKVPPPVTTEKSLLETVASQFNGLQLTDELSPNSGEIESFLPVLENAPAPVFAEMRPAYRENQMSGEKGMTFQHRIDSEIKRTPSTTQTYVVQQGDTYMTISDQFYGTSLLYTALAAHNRQLGIGWRPAEGVSIEIPTAEYLRLHYGESAHRQADRSDTQRSAVRYTVQEGDTIFRLATDKLQDSTRWREIFAMNADRLQDVRDLQPGMEILLPVRRL
ncbi:MAG: LysM peptidoglycan-binding domain-containing protein [Planctomycetaceae bacterium]|jgi:nucleoid-associated protein YgaU|nr:LysM peptidoglycan-binding domain-containing protein [Planctomycetaceae bacterium]